MIFKIKFPTETEILIAEDMKDLLEKYTKENGADSLKNALSVGEISREKAKKILLKHLKK